MQFIRSRKILILVIGCCFSFSLSAQINSPYSRYGLGNSFETNFAASRGIGGLGAAYFDAFNINTLNPASYASLGLATFDVGAFGNFLTLKTSEDKFTSGDGSLAYFSMGFPAWRKRTSQFGFSFGLTPYSGFQYDIVDSIQSIDTLLGTEALRYKGNGNVYQFYTGLGFKKDINRQNTVSFGANFAYLFGSLQNSTTASFPDQTNAITTKLLRQNTVKGFTYDYGIGYQRKFFNKPPADSNQIASVLSFGISGSPKITVDGSQSVDWYNIKLSSNEVETILDTLYSAQDTFGNITLPAKFRVGLMYRNYSSEAFSENKALFQIGIDFTIENWSQYAGIQSSSNLVNSNRIAVGAEITPKYTTGEKRPLTFRGGFYFGNGNLEIDGLQLKEYGATLGFGIPLGKGKNALPNQRFSKMNVALNVGYRGNSTSIKETYVKATIGFCLNDSFWFVKPQLR